MTEAPYGSWRSPITSDLIVSGTVGLSRPILVGDDIYWQEGRPLEGGRNVIVRRRPDGSTEDVNPAPFNARTRVHEYGGGDYTVAEDGTVYFTNFADQKLYRVAPGAGPEELTSRPDHRYADLVLDKTRNHLVCVREDHSREGQEAINTIVAIDLETGSETVLVQGNDFYADPRLITDGTRLCWLAWDHPNMPWDGTTLHVANLSAGGGVIDDVVVAGGESESVFQPEWSPDGGLYFVSDRSGWWNLYRWDGSKVESLAPLEAEFGQPLWQFGASTYAFDGANHIVCSYCESGFWRLATLDLQSGEFKEVDAPFTAIREVRASNRKAVFLAASPTQFGALVSLNLASGRIEVLKRTSDLTVDEAYLSAAQAIEFPTEGGLTAHAFYYPPRNKDFSAPSGEKPPLLVMSHGGPTSATGAGLSLRIQYWTSRGIAVLDVNYGGSTGYGTEYRRRLNGRWGIVDVDDCANGAMYLAGQGLVDGDRLAITGGSAGGYTTLCALAFKDVFKAGASHYGVGDLEALARDTHKFESRYLDGLIGPYPERRDLYVERSPIHHVEGLSSPTVFFQGLEDMIVPPNQAEEMVAALLAKGVPVAYVAFEGEQHGFRKAENIKRSLDGELYFYSRVFGFELADPVEPLVIENL
ncbi:MAG TPA: S9 family peptidase [Dehalococcoidia bacterium]|nr:S9 family peptidase [Dehalococcoidia bacterium]